jgi:hypothetical protein
MACLRSAAGTHALLLITILLSIKTASAIETIVGRNDSNRTITQNNDKEALTEGKQDTLDELTVVGTIDGKVHGIHKQTGSHMWTVDTGGPMLSSFR